MALAIAGQADWSAGIYRGREAPDNAAYDLLNLLIDDEGQPFRRGGSAFHSISNTAAAITGIADVNLWPGTRTLVWDATDVYVLSGSLAPISLITFTVQPFARVARLGDYVALATGAGFGLYGGSLKAANYGTGTISLTQGSATATGVGTAWLANVDPGMILGMTGNPVVQSVQSDTSLTFRKPYSGTTVAGAGYTFTPLVSISSPISGAGSEAMPVASVGTPPRFLRAFRNRIYYSSPGGVSFNALDYHELPADALILGMMGMGDTAIVFTTSGAWTIENMNFDVIDDVGNVQQIVNRASELILWGDPGLAEWSGAPIVPAVDGVWLMPIGDAPVPIGDGIKPLYLSYVKAGYQPGTAATHRNHYFLPIVNGTTLVDVLVCRLDREFAWTRWSGHGASAAYAQRIGSTTRSPKLLGIAGQRVTELTNAWNPNASNASEADGTTHPILIDTRDYPTPAGRLGSTTKQVRARYEATAAGAISVTAKFSRGPEGSSYTSLTNLRGGAAADGLDESVWSVIRKAPAIRFRIESASALSSFTLRSVEARYTQSGVS